MMSFVYGFFGILLFTIVAPAFQLVARRIATSTSSIAIMAIAAIVAFIASIATGAKYEPQFHFWNATSSFSFGIMVYVFAFGAIYKSVSIEIILTLVKGSDHATAISNVIGSQIPAIFDGRTGILVKSGYVALNGSSFEITEAGRKFATLFTLIRRAFAIGYTGLYDFASIADPNEKP